MNQINLSISLGNLAKSINDTNIENIKYMLCEIIESLIEISDSFDIDLQIGFEKWKKKASSKKYF